MDKDAIFDAIEKAIYSAAMTVYGPKAQIDVQIERSSGKPHLKVDGNPVSEVELGNILGKMSAQEAKQILVEKISAAERPQTGTGEVA